TGSGGTSTGGTRPDGVCPMSGGRTAAGPAVSRAMPRVAGAEGDALGADRAIRLEAGHGLDRERPSQEALDVAEQLVLVHADERDRLAPDAGPAGAADPVDVVLGDH